MFKTKEQNKPPEKDLNEIKINNLIDKELKAMVWKMLTNLWRRMDVHSENLNRERESKRKYQIEVIIELKNTLEAFNRRMDEIEAQISKLENKAIENSQTEMKK